MTDTMKYWRLSTTIKDQETKTLNHTSALVRLQDNINSVDLHEILSTILYEVWDSPIGHGFHCVDEPDFENREKLSINNFEVWK